MSGVEGEEFRMRLMVLAQGMDKASVAAKAHDEIRIGEFWYGPAPKGGGGIVCKLLLEFVVFWAGVDGGKVNERTVMEHGKGIPRKGRMGRRKKKSVRNFYT